MTSKNISQLPDAPIPLQDNDFILIGKGANLFKTEARYLPGSGIVRGVVAGDNIEVDDTDPNYPIVAANIGVESVSGGTNITVDNTDPANPVVSTNGVVESVVAGANITVNNTDPANPVVSTNGVVESVVAGANITVDNTDPANPVVSTNGLIESVREGFNVFVDTSDPANPIVSALYSFASDSEDGITRYATQDEAFQLERQDRATTPFSLQPLFLQRVVTDQATSVTETTMTLNGNLLSLGQFATSVTLSMQYGLAGSGIYTGTDIPNVSTPGVFSQNIIGLDSNTSYEYFAQAYDPVKDEYAYGQKLIVTTPQTPVVDTIINITGTQDGPNSLAFNSVTVPTSVGGLVENGKFTTNIPNANAATKIFAQDAVDPDFIAVKPLATIIATRFPLDSSTTSTSLVINDIRPQLLSTGYRVWVKDSTMRLLEIGNVTTTNQDNSNNVWNATSTAQVNSEQIFYIPQHRRYVTTSDNQAFARISSDGANFTTVRTGLSDEFGRSEGIYEGNGLYMLLGSQYYRYAVTTDGVSWTPRSLPVLFIEPIYPQYAAYGNGVWLIGAAKGTAGAGVLLQSTDAINWTVVREFDGGCTFLGYVNNVWFAAFGFSFYRATNPSSSSNWTTIWDNTTRKIGIVNSVVHSAATGYFAFGPSSLIPGATNQAQSSDSVIWNNYSTDLPNQVNGAFRCIYANRMFVLAISISSGNSPSVYKSLNGANWVPVSTIPTSGTTLTYARSLSFTNSKWFVGTATNGSPNPYNIWNSNAALLYKYTCSSLSPIFGGALTTAPTKCFLGNQTFESSLSPTITPIWQEDTIESVEETNEVIAIDFVQRLTTGRNYQQKITFYQPTGAQLTGQQILRFGCNLYV